MEGLGALRPDPDQTPFHAAWESRVHALVLASPTRGNIDRGRFFRESIPGPQYLAMSYYERWFAALEAMLLEGGYVTPAELAGGAADPAAQKAIPRLPADGVKAALGRTGDYTRPGAAAPAFEPGARVRAKVMNVHGHTRLPRYARGKTGVVERLHGAHVFPDAHAHGLGEDPRPLYTVRFTAQELFGAEASATDSVFLDLFEPYLDPA
jgi:nitrile hydratase